MGPVGGRREARSLTANLVFVTQVVDPADPILGFALHLVRALEERAGTLVVIANEVRYVPADLGVEVLSLGKEDGAGRIAKGLRYQRHLADVCRRLRPATLLAHMCPTYLTVATPALKAFGGRSMLWFTHPAESASLRRAEPLADVILTALPGSYPRPSPKARAIGHSIDTDQFRLQPPPPRGDGFLLLALGRTAPTKNYPVVVRAVQLARQEGVDVRLRILGPSTTPAEHAHRDDLERLISSLGAQDAVTLEPGVDHQAIPGELARAHALVNAHATGSADKVVFEAMACGRPVLVSSDVFADLVSTTVDLRFREGDAADLAAHIVALARTPEADLHQLGALLHDRVERHHSVRHWADEVVRIADSLHAGGRRATLSARRAPAP